MEHNLRLIPLLPFLGAVTLFFFGRAIPRAWASRIAILAIGGAALVAMDAFFSALPEAAHAGGLHDKVMLWIASGDLKIDLAFRMDQLSGVMCFIITFIGTLIHIYSVGYMSHEEDYARFFSYLNLFCAAMLVLVLGDSLPVMFVGWEGVGLCSYLLIGFWYKDNANASAGKKAFITNRVGDFGFLLGTFLLFSATGTVNLAEIVSAASGSDPALLQPFMGNQTLAFWACVFLFIGATGKSAQLPLYIWLPDAMAGPTPVSALIHAATMVTAGVYMIARLSPLYSLAPAAMALVAIVGALTAVFAAIIGFAQNDFKKVLAYSTVSQLGFMFAAVGVGAFGTGVFHLGTHAFFKAGLFLCAGSVMHAMSNIGDIRKMGGLKHHLPWTHGVFLVCWLAICGVPVFSGFFSKDAIVASAFGTHIFDAIGMAWVGPFVGVMLLVAALGTAFYMSRLYYLVFSGECRADHDVQHHIHESPVEMVGPLVVLAGGAAIVGFFGLPGALFGKPELNLLAHWLEPVVGPEMHIPHGLEIGLMAGSTALALAGIFAARTLFRGGWQPPVENFVNAVPGFVNLVRDKFRVDELYAFLIYRPVSWLARGLFAVVDRFIIDTLLVHGPAKVVDTAGRVARVFQSGEVQRYVAAFAIGIAAIVYLASRPATHSELKVTQVARHVTIEAGIGEAASAALKYEVDFDSDGQIDRKTDKAEWTYEGSGTYTITVNVLDPRWNTTRTLKKEVRVD